MSRISYYPDGKIKVKGTSKHPANIIIYKEIRILPTPEIVTLHLNLNKTKDLK